MESAFVGKSGMVRSAMNRPPLRKVSYAHITRGDWILQALQGGSTSALPVARRIN